MDRGDLRATVHGVAKSQTIPSDWAQYTCSLEYLACGLSNKNGTSNLTIKEKNAFKNQNRVTVFQASKMEQGGRCGCGFRHVPVSLGT